MAEHFEERPEFNLHETHFDIITKPAPGMKVLGFGKNTPVQMCCMGDHFLGKRSFCTPSFLPPLQKGVASVRLINSTFTHAESNTSIPEEKSVHLIQTGLTL